MTRTCDTCGCPLGAADVEAAQCPVCRKTLWRHVAPKPPAARPIPRGTLVAPALYEPEPEEFGEPSASPIDRQPVIDGPQEPGGQRNPSPAAPVVEAATGDASSWPAVPAGAKPVSAAPVVSTALAPPEPAVPPQARRSGAAATVDPRNFEDTDWNLWSRTLGTAAGGGANGVEPSEAETADIGIPSGDGAGESRYVGKTPVAGREIARPGRESAAADYALGAPLGAGGMGVVYEATQRSIERTVALKLLRPEVARRRDRRDSLATEAIVTGELTHPNIVPIHDLGQDADGNLFYSMKRVEGDRWDEVLGRKSQAENLDVFLKVADAIAFAHSRGVVHRDLKPENVLLGGFGEVLVMDWGLAYATDRFKKLGSITTNTATGGSPAYMAPEQAIGFLIAGGWRKGEVPPVTTAIDVYLLGAILFEIATGSPPHSGEGPAGCLIAAAENRIREVGPDSGLSAIALRAMATDPADRYGTVEELQAAVREYRAHAESVVLAGRAQSLLEKGDLARAVVGYEDALELWPENPDAATQVVVARRRLARRRYALTAMTAAFLLAIGGGALGINHQRLAVLSANEDLKDSIEQEKLAKANAETAAQREREAGERARRAKEEAERAAEQQRIAKEEAQKARGAADKAAELERAAKENAITAQHDAEVAKGEAVQERERQRYQNYQGRVKLIDARIGENAFGEADRLLSQLAAESPDLGGWEWGRLKYLCGQGQQRFDAEGPLTAGAASADGSVAATGAGDGKVRALRLPPTDTTPGASDQWVEFVPTGLGKVTALAVSPDGSLIAAAGTGTADVIVFQTAAPAAAPARLASGLPAGRAAASLDFSADGRRLLSAGPGGLILWDALAGKPLGRIDADGDPLPLTCAALSPDGTAIAAGMADGQVLVWLPGRPLSMAAARVFDGHRRGAEFGDGFRYSAGEVTALAFLPDGRTLVSGDRDGRLLRWDADLASPRNDGRDLADALAGAASAVRDGDRGREPHEQRIAIVAGHAGPIRAIDVRAGGGGRVVLVTGGDDGLIKVWDAVEAWPVGPSESSPAATLRGHEGPVTSVAGALHGAARIVFSTGIDATARLWDLNRYGEVREIGNPVAARHEQEILSVTFDPSGRRLLTGGRDESLVLTDLADAAGEPRRSPKVHGEAISVPWVVPFPGGGRLATGYLDGSVAIWDVAGRRTLARVAPKAGSSLTPPAVSPDGQWVAAPWRSEADDRSVAVWSVERIEGGASDPDFVFRSRGEVFAVSFTSDGRLVFGDRPGPGRPRGGHLFVADLGPAAPRAHRVFGDGVEGRVYAIRPLPGGEVLVAGTATVGAAARVLRVDPATGKALGKPLVLAGSSVTALVVSRDGGRAVTLSNTDGDRSQSVEAWDLSSGARLWEIRRPDVRITAADIDPDGRNLLVVTEPVRRQGESAAGSSTMRLLDLETGEERRYGPDGGEPLLGSEEIATRVSGAAFAAGGRTFFLTGIHGVSEWDLVSRRRLPGTFDSHGAASAAGFSSDGRFIIDGHEDGSFDVRDVNSARLTPLVHHPGAAPAGPVTAAAFSPAAGSHEFLVAAGGALTLWELDPAARSVASPRSLTAETRPVVRDAAFSADGRWAAAACEGGEAWLWEVDGTGSPVRLVGSDGAAGRTGHAGTGHAGTVTTIAFPKVAAPDGFQVLATGGVDRVVVVWIVDVRKGEVAVTVPLRGHRGEVTGLAFFPGRIDALVSASGDGTAKLWDWDRGGLRTWDAAGLAGLGEPEEVLTLRGTHTAGLTAVDVSADGLTIATAGRDGRAVLWPAVAPPR